MKSTEGIWKAKGSKGVHEKLLKGIWYWKHKSTKETWGTGITVVQLLVKHMGLHQVIWMRMMMMMAVTIRTLLMTDAGADNDEGIFVIELLISICSLMNWWSGQSIDEGGEESIEMQ